MTARASDLLRRSLLFFFVLFALATSFSIALAQMSMAVCAVCFIALLILGEARLRTIPLNRLYCLIVGFVIWMVFASFFSHTPVNSIWNLREEWLFIIIPIGVYVMADDRRARIVMLALAIGVVAAAAAGLLQRFTGVDYVLGRHLHTIDVVHPRAMGFFSYPLTYGNYLATASVFVAGYTAASWPEQHGWRRHLLLAATVVGPIAVALANSRGPWLSVFIGLFILALLVRKPLRLVPAVILLAVVSLFVSPALIGKTQQQIGENPVTGEVGDEPSYGQYESRFYVWGRTLEIVGDHPLTGIGKGNFREVYADYVPADLPYDYVWPHAHSDLLQFAAIAGIPCAMLYIAIWLMVLWLLWRAYRQSHRDAVSHALVIGALAGSLAFGVASLPEAAFADEEVRQTLMLLWGAGLSYYYPRDRSEAA